MNSKLIFGLIAAALAVYGCVPYMRDVWLRKTVPHTFSWLIWFCLTAITCLSQFAVDGGIGAYVTGIISICCLIIFILSLRVAKLEFTKSDWICLLLAIAALPLLFFTKTPVCSAVLVTAIDAVAFLPTFRKSYCNPYDETLSTYAIGAMKFCFAILALDHYSVTAVFYPVSVVLMNIAFIAMVSYRKLADRPSFLAFDTVARA